MKSTNPIFLNSINFNEVFPKFHKIRFIKPYKIIKKLKHNNITYNNYALILRFDEYLVKLKTKVCAAEYKSFKSFSYHIPESGMAEHS